MAKKSKRGRGDAEVRGLEAEPVFPARSYARLTPGKAVRAFRELAGLTQAQLAKRAKLTQPTISAIESGAVSLGLRRAEQIARALRIHPSLVAFPNEPLPSREDVSFAASA